MWESLVTTDTTILDAVKADYMLLSAPGNIGFYKRAAFVEVFLFAKATKRVVPVYTLAVFEEAPPEQASPVYNGLLFAINAAFSLGIRTYDMTAEDTEKVFLELLMSNRWTAHNDGERTPTLLKALRRQFIPPIGNYRANALLKNNFYGGSHLIEFFDESKTEIAFLTAGDARHLLEKLSREVQDRTQLNLVINPDRLGNVVFQFPVTVLDLRVHMEEKGTQYRLRFAWHPEVGENGRDCTIISRATLDKSVVHQTQVPYNRQAVQVFPITAIDKDAVIEMTDHKTGLLLSEYPHGSAVAVSLIFVFNDPIPRVFFVDGQEHRIALKQKGDPNLPAPDYKELISQGVYAVERQQLIDRLDFKQYVTGMEKIAIEDVRLLIQKYDGQGAYLWDPFLRADDILRTLYFSPSVRVPLRAICSFVSTKRREDLSEDELSLPALMAKERTIFSAPEQRHHGLDLEFRAHLPGHGYGFHDRFLLFPGFGRQPARVYSLGTSVNGMGKSHHILQLVAYPQPVIDAFNDLWNKLQHPDCLIWKSPS